MNRNVYFPPSIFEAIKEKQKSTGETFNKIVSLALTDYLKLDKPAPTNKQKESKPLKSESKPVKKVMRVTAPPTKKGVNSSMYKDENGIWQFRA